MNPLFQSIFGGRSASTMSGGQFTQAPVNGLNGAFNGVFQRAQQLAQTMRDPGQLVKQYFPDAPADVTGNPDQLLGWLQQTGRVNPQMVQMARQMLGR